MIIDFSNPWVFIAWYVITAGLLFASFKLKKAVICLITVIYFLVILGISARHTELIEDMMIHRVFNFLGLAVGLSFYIVIDEIETRRKVISQVFKNRYKKNKNVEEEDADESDNTEGF